MEFQCLSPEVAGYLGPNTIEDRSVHPPIVSKANYEFEGWLGDDIIAAFPCYFVSDRLRVALEESEATGFEFDEVEVTISEQCQEVYPETEASLPKFHWLKITGRAGEDDFGKSSEHRLVISDRALSIIKQFQLTMYLLRPYEG